MTLSRRVLIPLLGALVACGSATPAPAPLASSASLPAAGTSSVPAAAMTDAGSPLALTAMASSDAAAADAGSAPATAEATPTPTVKGTLKGVVTTQPATAAKNAVVYLEDGPLDKAVNGTMDNHGMAFAPHVVVTTTNGKFTITNSDPFPHNAFSPDHEKWDIGTLPAKGSRSKQFQTPGVYTVLCNMHPNMKGYLLVLGSSYFAKADKEGAFSIADVPPGTYKVTAWAPGVKPSTQSVQVSGDVSVNFDLRR